MPVTLLARHQEERVEFGPIMGTMSLLALTLWLLGYPDQARHKMAAVVVEAEINADPLASSVTLFFADLLYRHMGEAKLLRNIQKQLSRLDTQYAIWPTKLESLSLQG
jgi:hypothetical protein